MSGFWGRKCLEEEAGTQREASGWRGGRKEEGGRGILALTGQGQARCAPAPAGIPAQAVGGLATWRGEWSLLVRTDFKAQVGHC